MQIREQGRQIQFIRSVYEGNPKPRMIKTTSGEEVEVAGLKRCIAKVVGTIERKDQFDKDKSLSDNVKDFLYGDTSFYRSDNIDNYLSDYKATQLSDGHSEKLSDAELKDFDKYISAKREEYKQLISSLILDTSGKHMDILADSIISAGIDSKQSDSAIKSIQACLDRIQRERKEQKKKTKA